MKKQNKNITNVTANAAVIELSQEQLNQDLRNSILVVSLLVNAFVLIGWITIQVTSLYDAQVAAFLFTR